MNTASRSISSNAWLFVVYHHRTVDTLGKMLKAGTITPEMHYAAKDFQAAFIVANLDPMRALPILRVPGTGRQPDLNERQLHARWRVHKALEALGGISSPAGSCVWHVVGLQSSVREWAIRQGWGGRSVRQEQAQGILIAALGTLVAHFGYGEVRRAHDLLAPVYRWFTDGFDNTDLKEAGALLDDLA